MIIAQLQVHGCFGGGGMVQGLWPIEDGKHITQIFRLLAKSASNLCAAVGGWG